MKKKIAKYVKFMITKGLNCAIKNWFSISGTFSQKGKFLTKRHHNFGESNFYLRIGPQRLLGHNNIATIWTVPNLFRRYFIRIMKQQQMGSISQRFHQDSLYSIVYITLYFLWSRFSKCNFLYSKFIIHSSNSGFSIN